MAALERALLDVHELLEDYAPRRLGISVSGLALALFKSKMMSDGVSSPFCCIRSFLSFFTNSTLRLTSQCPEFSAGEIDPR